MAQKVKPSFPFLCPIIYAPQCINEENRKLDGKLMLFLGDIPNPYDDYGSGHCAVLYEERVLWLMHPVDFRRATKYEF